MIREAFKDFGWLVIVIILLHLVWYGVRGTYRAYTAPVCPACGN